MDDPIEQQKRRRMAKLSELLREMRHNSSSWHQVARDTGVAYVSLVEYRDEKKFPELPNQIKIAEAYAGWTAEELIAYLDGRKIKRTKDIKALKQEIRAIDNLDDAEDIAKTAIEQLAKLGRQVSESSD